MARTLERLDADEDLQTGVVIGPPDLWSLSLLVYVGKMAGPVGPCRPGVHHDSPPATSPLVLNQPSRPFDVVGLGLNALDHLLLVAAHPQPGSRHGHPGGSALRGWAGSDRPGHRRPPRISSPLPWQSG